MKPSTKRLGWAGFGAVTAFAWPFAIKTAHASNMVVAVASPGTHRSVITSARAGTHRLTYEVTNVHSSSLKLELAQKTCSCIDARIEKPELASGESSELELYVGVPTAGKTSGAILLRANGSQDTSYDFVLSYDLSVELGAGLTAIPPSVQRTSAIAAPVVLTLSLSDCGTPTSVQARWDGRPEQLPVTLLGDWVETHPGQFAVVVELRASALADGLLVIDVGCGDSKTETVRVPVEVKYE
jgi:hypothetical protein